MHLLEFSKMVLIQLFIPQIVSYGIVPWCIFLVVIVLAARFLGRPGVVIGHILIAVIITKLDYDWVQSEMSKPDWDGIPDMDIVFFICAFIHTVLVNTALLPIGVLVCRWRSRRAMPRLVAATDAT